MRAKDFASLAFFKARRISLSHWSGLFGSGRAIAFIRRDCGDLRPILSRGRLSARTTPAIIQADSCFIPTGRGVASSGDPDQPAPRHGGTEAAATAVTM